MLIGYPSLVDEKRMVAAVSEGRTAADFDLSQVAQVADPAAVLMLQRRAAAVRVDAAVLDYAVRIVAATRAWPGIALGAGPRGSIALVRAARAQAMLEGRDFVVPDDVRGIINRRCGIASRWPRNCRSKASPPTTCCTRCWPRWTRPASEAPAPLLLALVLAWLLPAWRQASGCCRRRRGSPMAGVGAGGGAGCLALRRLATPDVARVAPEAWPVGVEREVELVVDGGARAMRVDLHDLHPQGWQADGLPRTLDLVPDAGVRFAYRLRPDERGDFGFDGVHLRLHSPWRLWRQRRVAGTASACASSNFAPLARLALLGAEQASRMVGAHVRGAAAKAPTSTRCATTVSATACARSTGRRLRACAG